MSYRISCVVLCLSLALAIAPLSMGETFRGKPIGEALWNGKTIEYVHNEILVALNRGYAEEDIQDRVAELGLRKVREVDRFGFMKLETSRNEGLLELIDRISDLKAVRFAEPNIIHRISLMPNDVCFSDQWGLHNTGQSPPGGTPDADINAPEAWDLTTGSSSIIIGVLDTGIPMQEGELSHPDLDDPSRFILGPNFIAGTEDPVDGSGHGTHVSGIIGAESNNGIGIAGVTWNCRVMAIKVFDDDGVGSTEMFRDGVIYAVDNGCRVINYSGGGSASSSSEHGVAYADSHGVVLCAAAGNNWQGYVEYPAGYATQYDNVICVSSTDHNDESSQFSSTGPEVTVSAPGGYGHPFDEDDIYSTFPNYGCTIGWEYDLPLNYAPLAGTSMACPQVTGFAGLILSMDPDLTPAEVRSFMISGADDLGPAGKDNQFGYGRINMFETLSLMTEMNIGHQPLENTKNLTTDYRVDCAIYSLAQLLTDSLLLYYDTGSGWNVNTLQLERGTSYAYGYIPYQSPGTYIDYYLFAKNTNGKVDSTEVFSFKVIDYQVKLDAPCTDTVGASEDTVWYSVTVTNDGTLPDNYELIVSANSWNSTLWDQTGMQELSETGTLAPDQPLDIQLRVLVPESMNSEADSAVVTATSTSDASQTAAVTFNTTSTGAPLTVPFLDTFNSTEIDVATWVLNLGVVVNEDAYGEPSPPYSLNFDGDPVGADTLVSQIFLISSDYPDSMFNLVYSYQRTGGGESPDVGDDLFVEFLDNSLEWVILQQHTGGKPDMSTFEEVSIALPPEAYHDFFRIRFRNTASLGDRDDWFVDNVSILYSPKISVNTSGVLDVTLAPDQSSEIYLYVENVGASNLYYDVEVTNDFSISNLFADLLSQGLVEPPRIEYPLDMQTIYVTKGADDAWHGVDVVFNAGGPDNFGHFWIDSDEPDGPSFDWIDISTTGTLVTGLADDNYVGPFPIGFEFGFYDSTYSEFYISSNGFIGFGPTDSYESIINMPMATWDPPNNIVALLWDDLNLLDVNNPGGEIRYQSFSDRLVIQYINVPEYLADVGDVFNGEIILSSDGTIRLQYLDLAAGFDTENCSVGIEEFNGYDGLDVVYCAAYLHDSLCAIISEPGVGWLTANPAGGVLSAGSSDTVTMSFQATGVGIGTFGAEIQINSNCPAGDPWTASATLTIERDYLPGDPNNDHVIDIDDVIFLVAYVFSGGAAPVPLDSGDADASGGIDIDDVVYLIQYIFQGGPAPCLAK